MSHAALAVLAFIVFTVAVSLAVSKLVSHDWSTAIVDLVAAVIAGWVFRRGWRRIFGGL